MSAIRVRDISEFDLIRRLEAALPAAARTSVALEVPIGDDATVASLTEGEMIVATADTMTDGIHFRIDWTTWENIGHKAIAVNLSDLAAMGAAPILATVSLGLTGAERVSDLEEMYRGLGDCAAAFGCVIAGGDITRTSGPLSIAITAIGETIERRILRRDAAREGDLIWVTGSIGAGAAGLALELLPDDDQRQRASTAGLLREALHRPIPRVAAGKALARAGVLCAMDLSDGLSGDLYKILAASDVDAQLRLAHLPIAAAVTALFQDEAIDFALRGGDDFELLFTAPVALTGAIGESLEPTGTSGTIIGEIRARVGRDPHLEAVGTDGERTLITPLGYDHFGAQTPS